jgi:hypothetical protein
VLFTGFDVESYPDINGLVPNEGLKEDTHQSDQTILHVAIFDGFARGDAVRNVQVNEFWG